MILSRLKLCSGVVSQQAGMLGACVSRHSQPAARTAPGTAGTGLRMAACDGRKARASNNRFQPKLHPGLLQTSEMQTKGCSNRLLNHARVK